MHFELKKSKICQFLTKLYGIVDKINQPNIEVSSAARIFKIILMMVSNLLKLGESQGYG
jgi:hypothetical protein